MPDDNNNHDTTNNEDRSDDSVAAAAAATTTSKSRQQQNDIGARKNNNDDNVCNSGSLLLAYVSSSPTALFVTVVRIILIILCVVSWYHNNNGLFVLLDPWRNPYLGSLFSSKFDTWTYVRETTAIHETNLVVSGSGVPVPSLVPFPVTVLHRATEGISNTMGSMIVSLLRFVGSTIVDLFIAAGLLRIGFNCIENETDDEESIITREEMHPRIRPKQSHVFEITATTSNKKSATAALFKLRDMPWFVAHLYYCSPVTVVSGLFCGSFQNYHLLCLVMAIQQATSSGSSISLTALYLVLAMYLQRKVHTALYAIPVALIVLGQNKNNNNTKNNKTNNHRTLYLFGTLWIAWFWGIHALHCRYYRCESFLRSVQDYYSYSYQWNNVTPSLSVLWYLNMELFDEFRDYFVLLINRIPFLLVIPITVRLYRYPMVLFAVYGYLFESLFAPESTLCGAQVSFGCFAMFSFRSLARVRPVPFSVCLCAFVVPVSLYVVTMHLWLEVGSGEPTHAFFQCLAYNVFFSVLFLEFVGASLRRDKALRITVSEKKKKEKQKQTKTIDNQ